MTDTRPASHDGKANLKCVHSFSLGHRTPEGNFLFTPITEAQLQQPGVLVEDRAGPGGHPTALIYSLYRTFWATDLPDEGKSWSARPDCRLVLPPPRSPAPAEPCA